MSDVLPRWEILDSREKRSRDLLPFLTFPVTKSCNFRCGYCGEGGELTASRQRAWDAAELLSFAKAAKARGVTKLRVTGGEPFMHPQIDDILRGLADLDVYVHVNTNGSLVSRHVETLEDLGPNFHFAVSLDTLDAQAAQTMSGTRARSPLPDILCGTDLLRGLGLLLRVNMVVTTINAHEIPGIIDFCRATGCGLKLLDVVSVPLPFGVRRDLHVSLERVEAELARASAAIVHHQYARSFGTPCRIYDVDGVPVTVKSTWNGSRYDTSGICSGCPYFPCHEGLYDIFALPDHRVIGCRWSETSVAGQPVPEGDAATFVARLEDLAAVFQAADHVARQSNNAMPPRPAFVLRSTAERNAP
ncbi:MAG: 3,8-cyclase [Actinomycetota bacterium]|nr:3,8-cyclase [Actinomycetota bacterium]MDQ1294678.1 3,8-cyclase [Actinomycetota bacterium]